MLKPESADDECISNTSIVVDYHRRHRIFIAALAGRLPAWRHLQRHWQAIFEQFHSGRLDFILTTFNTFGVLDILSLCQ